MLKSPFRRKSQLLNMRGPGIILLTNTKSPGIMVGDIEPVGIANDANRNTRNAIAKIMENINTRNQPNMLLRMRLIFDRFDLSPQGKGTASDGSSQWGTDSEFSPQGRVTESDWLIYRLFFNLKKIITVI
jgi:hypothetical protein